jgi:hypothetical protein
MKALANHICESRRTGFERASPFLDVLTTSFDSRKLRQNQISRQGLCWTMLILYLRAKCRQALVFAGFDVAFGLLHADKLYRDSLVYDLMELCRSKVDHPLLKFFSSTTFLKERWLHSKKWWFNQHQLSTLSVYCFLLQTKPEPNWVRGKVAKGMFFKVKDL